MINANKKRSFSSFNRRINLFIEQLSTSIICSRSTSAEEGSSTNDSVHIRCGKPAAFMDDNNLNLFLSNQIYTPFTTHQTCWINKLKYSIYTHDINGKTSDSCVLYRDDNLNNIGFIMAIVSESNNKHFVVRPAILTYYDQFCLRQEFFTNKSVVYGQFNDTTEFKLMRHTHLLLKLAFKIEPENKCTFFIFPNTTEST